MATLSGSELATPYLAIRLRRARLGIGVGMLSILMLFISFTSAYVVRQGLPTLDPAKNILVHDWFPTPLPKLLFFNTALLILSSLTVELARRRATRSVFLSGTGQRASVASRDSDFAWLALTALLGGTFLVGQWTVWRDLAASGYYLATGPSSSFLYLLTGVHAVHLSGGMVALLVVCTLTVLRRSIQSRAVALDVTAWYWHFMTLLWIYILCLLEFVR